MRIVKWKTLIENYYSPEYEEYSMKGTAIIEDDSLSDEEIRSRIEEKLLTQEQRDNMVSKISIKHIPII